MIPYYFLLPVLGVLGIVCAVAIVLAFRLRSEITTQNHDHFRALQNLRHETNTKLYALEKWRYEQAFGSEVVLYDGRTSIGKNDFSGNGERVWDYVAHSFTGENGEGSYSVNGNTIVIDRTNTGGRYELHAKNLFVDGQHLPYLPADDAKDVRLLGLSFEVKRTAASHTLRFVFKTAGSKEVLDEKDYVAFSPDWEAVHLYFTIATKEDCIFRIDDLSVLSAPSSVYIRNFVLVEKEIG